MFTVVFLAALAVAGASSVSSSEEVRGMAEQALRGGRKLQAQPLFCSTVQCPERSTLIETASTTECGDICDPSLCCEARCSFHECPVRTTPVVDADLIVCADLTCTDDMCCEALCSYFQCPDGEVPVVDADDIACPGLECNAAMCCEEPTNTTTNPVDVTASPTPAPV